MSRFSQKFILVRRRRRMKSPIWQTITWPLMSSDEHCKARRGSWWEERALAKVRSFFAFETRFHLAGRSEEHTSELQSLMRISYAVFCLKQKNNNANSVK